MDYFLDHHENILGMILIWDIPMHLASRECSRAGAKGVKGYLVPRLSALLKALKNYI